MSFIRPEALAALPEIVEVDDSAELPTDTAVSVDETPPPADSAPPADAPPAPPVEETPPAPPAEEPANTDAEDAAALRELREAFENDPIAYARAVLGQLSAEEQAQIIGQQPTNDEPAEDEEGWRDEDLVTGPDHFVREHREEIAALPQFREAVAQEFQVAGQYIAEAIYQAAELHTLVELLLEHAEIKLPEIKRADLLKGSDGKKSYKEILAEKYLPEAKKVIGTKKAKAEAEKNLPTTPRSSAPDDDNDTPLYTQEEALPSPSKPGKTRLTDLLGQARLQIAQQKR
jgi:hypothetical protein